MTVDQQQHQQQQQSLGRVGEDHSVTRPSLHLNHHAGFQQHQQHQHEQQQHGMNNNTGMRPNGEFSVATPKNFERHQAINNPSNNDIAHVGKKQPQQSQHKGVFGQLTSKLYSILDVACDRSWVSPVSPVSPQNITPLPELSDQGTNNRSRTLSAVENPAYYSHGDGVSYSGPGDHPKPSGLRGHLLQPHREEDQTPEDGSLQPPRFKMPTLSGLTDDHCTLDNTNMYNKEDQNQRSSWESWFASQNNGNLVGLDANHALAQAMDQNKQQQQPLPDASDLSPGQLLNEALNQVMNQQNATGEQWPNNASPNQALSPNEALNQVMNQAMSGARRVDHVSFSKGGTTLDGNTASVSYKPMKGVLKQPKANVMASKKSPNNGSRLSLTKMKRSLFSSFSKRTPRSPNVLGAGDTKKANDKAAAANNNRQQRPENSFMRTRSKDKLLRGSGLADDSGGMRENMQAASKSNSKSNIAAASSRKANTDRPSSDTNGQIFSLSKKKSKLVEV